MKLLENFRKAVAHRLLGKLELGGDLLVGVPLGHQPQDLDLALGKLGVEGLAGLLLGAEVLDDVPGKLRVQKHLPCVDAADGVHQLPRVHVLEEVAPGPRLHRLKDVGVLAVHGEHDDLGLGPLLEDGLGGLHPVQARHLDVHEDHVGLGLQGVAHGLPSVLGLPHHPEVPLGLQEAFQPLAEKGVVVRQKNPDHPSIIAPKGLG